MVLLRRPVPRFFVWATLLVAVAVATGAGGLAWWLIALVELAAWAAVTLAERTLWHLSVAVPAERKERAVVPPPPSEAETEPAEAPASEPEPEPVPAPAPAAAPAREPSRRRVLRTPARGGAPAAQLPRDLVRWNIWNLERLARDHPNAEELQFLVLSLREFANSDGQLPADFDPLVRESFGDLLTG